MSTRKLAAIMFTDMVGYTAMMQKDEQLANLKRTRHKEVLERMHKQHGGEILQYFGDGTVSIFNSAVEAVNCALEIQRLLKKEPNVPLRIGIHIGDIVYDKEGIYGDGVNIAARIESLSVAGAVLFSSNVYDLIKSQPYLQAYPLGSFQLKNVEKEIELYALSNDGLTTPTAYELSGSGKAAPHPPQRLPQVLTSFIGRNRELEQIKTLLAEHKLVTLTGPGGSGKTRLALEIARDLKDHFPDGTYFHSLAPIREYNLVAPSIAQELNLAEDPFKGTNETLIDFLENKRLLLILDNFEQVIEAADLIDYLLRRCPHLKVLVTSRVNLHLEYEQEFAVKPFALPDPQAVKDPDSLRQYPAIELFITRAKSIRSDLSLDPPDLLTIAEICSKLDGLPLAIELAAARIKMLSTKAILSRLESSFEFLKDRSRNRPQRHRTLDRAISWSYDLLDEKEQLFFRSLSVFVGGFSLEAAEYVIMSEIKDDGDVFELVETLLDQSLIRAESEIHGEQRFDMLETIREFCLKKSQQAGELDSLRRKHADYFVHFAERVIPQLTKKNQIFWLDRLDADYNNFWSALIWTDEENELDLGLHLGSLLCRYWHARSHMMEEGIHRLKSILEKSKGQASPNKIAKALLGLGFITDSIYYAHDSRSLLQESLQIFQDLQHKKGEAAALNYLSWNAIFKSDYEQAESLAYKAIAIAKPLNLHRIQAACLNNISFSKNYQSRLEEAHDYALQAIELRKQIGDIRLLAFNTAHLGVVKSRMGRFQEADETLKEAIEILERINDKLFLGLSFSYQGMNLMAQGHHERARRILESAYSIILQIRYAPVRIMNIIPLIECYSELGQHELADKLLGEIGPIVRKFGSPYYVSYYLSCKAFEHLKRRETREGFESINQSIKLKVPIDDFMGLVETLEYRAHFYLIDEKFEESARDFWTADFIRKQKNLPIPPRFTARRHFLEDRLATHFGQEGFQRLRIETPEKDIHQIIPMD